MVIMGFKEHPEGKELPTPPPGKKPYDGWSYVGDKFKEEKDPNKWLPLRDAVGGSLCPLMSAARAGGGDAVASCVHQTCAFYTELQEPSYQIGEDGRPVMETAADGRVSPKIEEDCVKGFCALAMLPSQLYTQGALLKRIATTTDVFLQSALQQQQVGAR